MSSRPFGSQVSEPVRVGSRVGVAVGVGCSLASMPKQ